MRLPAQTVVGVDVGGKRKGFHAVALRGNIFTGKITSTYPEEIVKWCLDHNATVVSVDAPCAWSKLDSSRLAERELALAGQKIHCFATPTRERAKNHSKGFYDWVFNGEKLYEKLWEHYSLYNGEKWSGRVCIETFPHAVVCALTGLVVTVRPRASVRRKALLGRGYDISNLPNIDYVDAAICAVAADKFRNGNFQHFGNREEGFIIVPA